MSHIKVSANKPIAAVMAALTIFASLSFAGCENPLIPIPAETPTVSNAVSEVATPVIPVPGNFSGVAEEVSTEFSEPSEQSTGNETQPPEVSTESSEPSEQSTGNETQPPEVSTESSEPSEQSTGNETQPPEVSTESSEPSEQSTGNETQPPEVSTESSEPSEQSTGNSVEDYAQQPPDSGTHAGSDASNYKVEDYDILYLKDVSFLTMREYGFSGDVHKDALLDVPLVYKDITIPEGTVMNVWGTYSEDEYVLRWYDNFVILPKSAVTLTDDPLRNICQSIGIDEMSVSDIHSNPSVALPTKKLEILDNGEEIQVFDFNESDTRYFYLGKDGHIWSINLANVRFVEPTYGLYTPAGEQPRWVRILEECWTQTKPLTPYEKAYKIQWGGDTRMIPGEDISVITENTDVIPKYTPFPAEFTGEISGEYGILQGTLQLDVFEQPVPAGTAVQIISIDDSGNTIINWYGSQLRISDWLVKVDESIEYKEGCLSDKSGPLITAGILIKGISPSSDFSYISEKYISGI